MGGNNRQIETNINKMRYIGSILSWFKREDGATAIEFSMLAAPLFYMLMGTLEMSMIFATNVVLDGATNDAARLIRTGQAQQYAGNPEDLFKSKLCEKASILLDCSTLKYEVVEMSKFADFNNYAPSYDKDGNLVSRGFDPGGVNSVNLIRVSYNYKVATPMFAKLLSNAPNGSRTMTSTVVLEAEPYDLAQVAGGL